MTSKLLTYLNVGLYTYGRESEGWYRTYSNLQMCCRFRSMST